MKESIETKDKDEMEPILKEMEVQERADQSKKLLMASLDKQAQRELFGILIKEKEKRKAKK